MYPRPPSSSSLPALAALAALMLMVLATPPAAHAKRFDCQMFCRRTGFSGMVGGCRCSFTLFTAKRAVRDHNSVPGEPDSYYGSELPETSLTDLLRLSRETHESFLPSDSSSSSSSSSSLEVPHNHPVRLLLRPTPAPGAQLVLEKGGAVSRFSRSPAPQVIKRKEFEQDLDNGDTSDYFRLPY